MISMYGPEEMLDVGAPRRPVLVWVVVAVLAAGGLAGYVLTRSSGHHVAAARTTSAASSSPEPGPSTIAPVLPAWPQRPAACGGTSFLPIVSSARLDRATGIRAVVGDRLATVDLDTGRMRPASGLRADRFASGVVTTGAGTFALLGQCGAAFTAPVSVVRIDRAGRLHTVTTGRYDYLLGGGSHPWAVTIDDVGQHQRVNALDGTRPSVLPDDFGPIAGWHDDLVGVVQRPNASDQPFSIRVLNPRTRALGLALGPATSVAVQGSTVLWTPDHCYNSCPVHRYDLATRHSTVTRAPVDRLGSVSGAIVSADGRTAALVRQRARPGPYDQQHPGNPNEVVTVDLDSGAVHVVPDLILWSKAAPGLTFSPDGRWLLIGLDEGTDVRVLLWRPGLGRPLESPARLPGLVAYAPTVTAIS